MELMNPSAVNPWEAQAGYDFASELEEGTIYFLKMKIKGSVRRKHWSSISETRGVCWAW